MLERTPKDADLLHALSNLLYGNEEEIRRVAAAMDATKQSLNDHDVDLVNRGLYEAGYAELVVIEGNNAPEQREAALLIMSVGLGRFVAAIKTTGGIENYVIGVEHVGLYATPAVSADLVADWYHDVFGFKVSPGTSSMFLSALGPGRIEIMMRGEEADLCHLAILVSDFGAAITALTERGVEFDNPTLVDKPDMKVIYLLDRDPVGNRIHLLWRR